MTDLRNVPILDEQLKSIEAQIDKLKEEAREAITTAVVTDENLSRAYEWMFVERYILIRPDGSPALGFPYGYGNVARSQRPAAIRALRNAIPGTRLLDRREKKIITQAEAEEA